MKILIRMLLLTIVILFNFGELNSSGNLEASSSSRIVKGVSLIYANKYSGDGLPQKTVKYMDVDIELWLDSTGTIVLKAWYPHCGIPQGDFYKDREFLICLIEVEKLKLVAYKSHDGSLIGVRAPCKSRIYGPEPTEREWYIIYFERTLKLTVQPETEIVTEIRLMPRNAHGPRDSLDYAKVAGIEFTVFRAGMFSPKIKGVKLGFV